MRMQEARRVPRFEKKQTTPAHPTQRLTARCRTTPEPRRNISSAASTNTSKLGTTNCLRTHEYLQHIYTHHSYNRFGKIDLVSTLLLQLKPCPFKAALKRGVLLRHWFASPPKDRPGSPRTNDSDNITIRARNSLYVLNGDRVHKLRCRCTMLCLERLSSCMPLTYPTEPGLSGSGRPGGPSKETGVPRRKGSSIGRSARWVNNAHERRNTCWLGTSCSGRIYEGTTSAPTKCDDSYFCGPSTSDLTTLFFDFCTCLARPTKTSVEYVPV